MRIVTVAGLAGLAVIGLSACQKNGAGAAGGSSVDLGKFAAAVHQAAADFNGSQSGKAAPAVDPQKLKSLLPDSVAGMPRTQLTATSVGPSGGVASSAEAVYGANQITITIVDLAAAQGLTAIVMAVNANSDTETATGYDKQSTINGRMTTESWDRQSKGGKFGVVVANRFSVEASGNANSIDDLKAAVAAVGPDRLEAFAHG